MSMIVMNGAVVTLDDDDAYMDHVRALEQRIHDLERFAGDFLDPEQFGYSVTAEVRDRARMVLGLEPVETEGC